MTRLHADLVKVLGVLCFLCSSNIVAAATSRRSAGVNNTHAAGCQWTFKFIAADPYTVSPCDGTTNPIKWPDTLRRSPEHCTPEWSCFINSQKFWQDAYGQEVTFRGNISDETFAMTKTRFIQRNCPQRFRWSIQWDAVSPNVALLGGLTIRLNITCNRPTDGMDPEFTINGCLLFKTKGYNETDCKLDVNTPLSEEVITPPVPTENTQGQEPASSRGGRAPGGGRDTGGGRDPGGGPWGTPGRNPKNRSVITPCNCTQLQKGRCMARCTSKRFQQLEHLLRGRANPVDIISGLAESLVEAEENISGDHVIRGIGLLRRLVHAQYSRLNNESQQITREEAVNFTKAMITCGSALLKKHTDASWKNISEDLWSEEASGIVDSSERAAILLARTVPNEAHWISEENIVMTIKNGSTETATFPDLGNSPVWAKVDDGITLPRTEHHVISAIYSKIGQYLKPKSVNRTVNSRIISATLVNATLVNGNSTAAPSVDGNVTIVLEHTDETINNSIATCVFWDVSHGNWSDEGCTVATTNATHTICECNHLTSFAILVDTTGLQHSFALSVITYIGCVISIVCLFICICVFLGFRRVRCHRTIIHANLCICLLVAEVVFLAAVDKTQNKSVCTAIAIALHYLFLAVFAWMCVEGIELYVMLVRIFNLKKSRMVYYYLIGYGTPGVVVVTSVTINYLMELDGYVTEKYCWLAVKNYFIFSFVGPMLFVILVNIGFLVMTLKIIHAKRSSRKSEESRGKKIRHWIRVSLSLICVLGVTWVFGVLYIVRETIAFAYAFALINSLQGLFILIFHCLLNEKVQDEMIRGISGKRKSMHSTGSMTTFRRTLGSFSSTSLHTWKTPPTTTVTSYPRTLQGTRLDHPIVIPRVQLPKQHH